MSRQSLVSLASAMLLSAACSSSAPDPMAESGGTADENAGRSSAIAGSAQLPTAGATASAGSSAAGANGGNGGSASRGGSGALGGSGAGAGASAAGGANGGVGGGAHAGSGGASAGSGGANAGTGGGAATGGSAGAAGSACPGSGHITYTLAKSASPSATEQAAYDLITKAMDRAITYYDCYTNITKKESVSYVPSVETADGNINGSIRFGMNTTYMDYRSAIHEIAHTVGIGQASNWGSFVSGGLFTGSHAAAQLKAINAKLATPLYAEVHADTQHFWPYGINQQSEVKSEADLIAHCQMVLAIREDLGL